MSSSAELNAAQQSVLLASSREAADRAYAPYSGFRVGAALLLADGSIVTAANVENASFGLTICAERAAVVRAVAEHGASMRIAAAAVSNLSDAAGAPCGACRQVLAEFMPASAPIFFPGAHDGRAEQCTLAELLPFRFELPR